MVVTNHIQKINVNIRKYECAHCGEPCKDIAWIPRAKYLSGEKVPEPYDRSEIYCYDHKGHMAEPNLAMLSQIGALE